MLETCRPMDIEARSFEIITELLGDHKLDPENALVIKRAIHTTADFDYADNLVFSPHAVQKGIEALKAGCDIVTDTLYAGYPHFHFYANPTFAVRFLDACRKEKNRHAGTNQAYGH